MKMTGLPLPVYAITIVLGVFALCPGVQCYVEMGRVTCYDRHNTSNIFSTGKFYNPLVEFFSYARDEAKNSYRPNMRCELYYEAPALRTMYVEFHPCQLGRPGQTNTCEQDRITVDLGQGDSEMICNTATTLPPSVETDLSTLNVEFVTDATNEGVGCTGFLLAVRPRSQTRKRRSLLGRARQRHSRSTSSCSCTADSPHQCPTLVSEMRRIASISMSKEARMNLICEHIIAENHCFHQYLDIGELSCTLCANLGDARDNLRRLTEEHATNAMRTLYQHTKTMYEERCGYM